MKLSDYVQKTGNFKIVQTVKRYATNDLKLAEKSGAMGIYQTVVGLVDVEFEDGVYTIYHTNKAEFVNGEWKVDQIIHYQGNDKKQAVNVLMNLYDIQAQEKIKCIAEFVDTVKNRISSFILSTNKPYVDGVSRS